MANENSFIVDQWPEYVRRQPLRYQLLARKGAGYVKKSLSDLIPTP